MIYIELGIFISCIFLVGFLFLILIRSQLIWAERKHILECEDNYKHFEERMLYEKYSYNEMLFKFWKPVKSFYKVKK